MITSNTSIPFIKAENSENKFYLSRLTSEYNEGDSITTSTAINCRKLAIAIKAGDKITINGTSLTVYADAAVDATSFFVQEITLDEALNINANIAIDEDNMFVQYQRKTEGTVAGFDIDADGMSKGGVEITGWLDSDTMEGATENNIPTAQSVKAYVDGQAGHSETLQEVTDNGNTTTNSIMIGSSSSPSTTLHVVSSDETVATIERNSGSGYTVLNIKNGVNTTGNSVIRFSDTTASKGKIDYEHADDSMRFNTDGSESMRITSAGNVGIGDIPSFKLDVNVTSSRARFKSTTGDANIELSSIEGHDWLIKSKSDDSFTIYDEDAATERMRIDSSGNVGIGTTSPYAYESTATKLHVDSGGEEVARFEGESDADGSMGVVRIGTSNDRGLYFEGGRTGSVSYGKIGVTNYLGAKTESIYIKSDGNVGIGTTTDSGAKLDVSGVDNGVFFRRNTGQYFKFTTDAHSNRIESAGKTVFLGTTDAQTLYLKTNDSSRLTITSGGNVLIGTTTDDGYQLDVNGTQRVQDVLELDDVLTLNAISTPDDPDEGKSSIYMDSADGAIKVKINFEGEVVTRTIASFDG